jgi:hypothetical protein
MTGLRHPHPQPEARNWSYRNGGDHLVGLRVNVLDRTGYLSEPSAITIVAELLYAPRSSPTLRLYSPP